TRASARARRGAHSAWAGRPRSWPMRPATSRCGRPPPSRPSSLPGRRRAGCHRAFAYSRAAGWWKAPSHTTYKTRLTSKSVAPIIGLTGLLNLLRVGTRLQAARDLGSQEGGAPCPSSRLPTQLAHSSPPPSCPLNHLTATPAVPPVLAGGAADVLGTT